MIVAEQKPIEEIRDSIAGHKRVLVLGCGTCVTVCLAGGEREVSTLAAVLRLGSECETLEGTLERQCDAEFFADINEEAGECDAILSPTAPSPPFKIGEKVDDPMQMYLTDVFTIPVNMAGLPGISIPGGFSSEGLPIGVQLIAPHFEEARLVQLSSAFQKETDHHLKRPSL